MGPQPMALGARLAVQDRDLPLGAVHDGEEPATSAPASLAISVLPRPLEDAGGPELAGARGPGPGCPGRPAQEPGRFAERDDPVTDGPERGRDIGPGGQPGHLATGDGVPADRALASRGQQPA